MESKLKVPKFEISPIKKFLYTYKNILSIAYKINPSLLILVTILNSFWGLTNLPVLYINKILIDIVIKNIGGQDISLALKVITLLVSLRALIEFIRFVLSRMNNVLTNTLIKEIQASLEVIGGGKLNSLDIPTIESSKFQDRYKRIEREGSNRLWGMIGPLSDIPNEFFTIVSGIIPIFAFNSWISFLVILVTLPDILINARLAKRDSLLLRELSPKWRMWDWILSHLINSRHFYENKILGNTEYLSQKLTRIQKGVLDKDHKNRMSKAVYRSLGGIPGSLLSLGLNAYFFSLALLGKVSVGTAQLLYGATNTLATGFSGFVNNAVSIYENYLFVIDLVWFLDLKPKFTGGELIPPKFFSTGIEFKDVWFKYDNTDSWVLKGISFSIGPRENLALVGENGAGKTTIIKLLCGFYKPQKGEIVINGRNIFDYDVRNYWDILGVLFQDFSEYPFTAKESIGIGDVKKIKNREEIVNASRLTGINDFINSLPLKYENPLAKEFDKGVSPSRGQWQRIALSRILFRDAKIIVLDEPTSNVDPQAEEEIFEKIIELASEKMLILISHRFSTVRLADKIIVIENGHIIEEGTHSELLKKKGEYFHLFKLQAAGYQ